MDKFLHHTDHSLRGMRVRRFSLLLKMEFAVKIYNISDLPRKIVVQGVFSTDLSISISLDSIQAIERGKLRIKLISINRSANDGKNSKIIIGATRGNFVFRISGTDNSIEIGDGVSGDFDFVCGGNSSATIGDMTTSRGMKIYLKNSKFICGRDCMFSTDILAQTSDQHGIVDLKTGEINSYLNQMTRLGDHVWVGRRASLMPNSHVRNGSIIGAASVVTGEIETNSLAVGVPARVIRDDVSWSRQQATIDPGSQKYFKSLGLSWCDVESS